MDALEKKPSEKKQIQMTILKFGNDTKILLTTESMKLLKISPVNTINIDIDDKYTLECSSFINLFIDYMANIATDQAVQENTGHLFQRGSAFPKAEQNQELYKKIMNEKYVTYFDELILNFIINNQIVNIVDFLSNLLIISNTLKCDDLTANIYIFLNFYLKNEKLSNLRKQFHIVKDLSHDEVNNILFNV